MTTANKITIARIVLVPVFVVVLLRYTGHGEELYRWLALVTFTVAAVGDAVDGYVARRFHQRTDLGSLLDPLADKLLLVLGLVVLSLDNRPWLERVPLWLTATVLCRDVMLLLLLVLVNSTVGQGRVRPHFIGKTATVLQMGCVLWVLLKLHGSWLEGLAVGATACTAVSGVLYARDGFRMLRTPQTPASAAPPASTPPDPSTS